MAAKKKTKRVSRLSRAVRRKVKPGKKLGRPPGSKNKKKPEEAIASTYAPTITPISEPEYLPEPDGFTSAGFGDPDIDDDPEDL